MNAAEVEAVGLGTFLRRGTICRQVESLLQTKPSNSLGAYESTTGDIDPSRRKTSPGLRSSIGPLVGPARCFQPEPFRAGDLLVRWRWLEPYPPASGPEVHQEFRAITQAAARALHDKSHRLGQGPGVFRRGRELRADLLGRNFPCSDRHRRYAAGTRSSSPKTPPPPPPPVTVFVGDSAPMFFASVSVIVMTDLLNVIAAGAARRRCSWARWHWRFLRFLKRSGSKDALVNPGSESTFASIYACLPLLAPCIPFF